MSCFIGSGSRNFQSSFRGRSLTFVPNGKGGGLDVSNHHTFKWTLTSALRHNPEHFETWSSNYLREVLSNAVARSKRKWKGSITRPERTKIKKNCIKF